MELDTKNFQTPIDVCNYMASLIPKSASTILEPTPGIGNLASACVNAGKRVDAVTGDFFERDWYGQRFDCVVMNPPFTPMITAYKILDACMELSDEIIALMPWLTLINSSKRTTKLFTFGLKSVTCLPRRIFNGSRVQTCILHLSKQASNSITSFYDYDTLLKKRTV